MSVVTAPWTRWVIFNGVGAIGVVVQLGVLAALLQAGLPVAAATALAVEAAVLHNFLWHQRVTWRDRRTSGARDALGRLARFHALNGTVSLAGNVAITWALSSSGVEPILANGIAIASCSTINFLAGDRLVFAKRSALRVGTSAVLLLAALPTGARAASDETVLVVSGPTPAALAAWDRYVRTVDERHARSAADDYFALDTRRVSGWREKARAGSVPMVEVDPPGAPDSKIHHWAGAIYVPATTVDAVVKRLQEYAGRESEFYEEVKASRLLERTGDTVRVFLRLERGAAGITATLNSEHTVEYRRFGGNRAGSRSVATKIAELQNVGTPKERERAPGKDRGFLWRLNAYWRFEQAGDGVLIECESVSLSRSVPLLIRPFVSGIVDRIARESLERTLRSLRTFLSKS